MMNLTNRDIDILRTSSLGVANFKMLLHTLTNAYGHTISDAALLRRLSILSRAGYIARRKEAFRKKHGHFAVYGLTRQAAKVLAELGYPLERMRIGLPTTFFVRHDLNVTSILHVVHQESCRNYYQYDFLDSVVLKQYRGKASQDPIPDIRLNLYFRSRTDHMNIEIDMGTVLIRKMVRRIATQSRTAEFILVMCHTRTHLQSLRKACAESRYDGNRNNVYFALINDFLKGAFRHTDFISVANKKVAVRFDDEQTR
jgi:DNA-binding HxlR family transcriptional regulator